MQKLFAESKVGKSLIYGLGEITLIVIGILIALQVDTWAENNREAKMQTYYLQSLQLDLAANHTELQRVINISKHTIALADSILQLSEVDITTIDLEALTKQIQDAGNYSIFNNKSSTVSELMATGDLRLIKNDRLRSHVANWESEIEDIRSFESPNTENARSYIRMVKMHLDLYKAKLNQAAVDIPMISALFQNREFMNSLLGRTSYSMRLAAQYQKQKKKTEELLELIDEELSKK